MATRRDSLVLAAEVIEGQVRKKTRKEYDSKITRLTEWMKSKHPEHFSQQENAIIIPLGEGIIEEYLGYICQHEDGSMKSASDLGPQDFKFMIIFNKIFRRTYVSNQ